jgi:hypothetical protein
MVGICGDLPDVIGDESASAIQHLSPAVKTAAGELKVRNALELRAVALRVAMTYP